jgi:DNA-binding MarR family transcriptional regulator
MNESVVFTLIGAAHRIEGRLEEALTEVKLSGPKFAALNVLMAHGESLSLGEMAEKLTCVRSNVTQLIDRLEADGLVKRTDDPQDRRAVRAEVTKLGRDRHAAGQKVVDSVLTDVARELAVVDVGALKRAFESIR